MTEAVSVTSRPLTNGNLSALPVVKEDVTKRKFVVGTRCRHITDSSDELDMEGSDSVLTVCMG